MSQHRYVKYRKMLYLGFDISVDEIPMPKEFESSSYSKK
jgi:hypothetical protein